MPKIAKWECRAMLRQENIMETFFPYSNIEIDYLKSHDKRLAAVIEKVGHIRWSVDTELFPAVVHNIVAQQISTKAQETVWHRMEEALGEITPQTLLSTGRDRLQSMGMSFRKVEYILDFASKVFSGECDLEAIKSMPDAEAIAALSSLRGIGVWTAEMLLLFCLCRPDILSYGDLGIQRGMRMVYRHRVITPALFKKYRRRLAPYGSIASLYFWEVAGGAIPELTDPATPQKNNARKRKA